MKLERVALKGFLSHRDTSWEPNGARLVSLVGANGAGKSTLASDALTYALFDQARGKTDDVVRLGETDASVVVEFTYSGNRYRVTRGRTTKSGGRSYLELAIADGEAWRTLTADTIRETQAAITELLRLDADTFATAVLLGQGQANRFAEVTPADRKRILSTVLGLDVYAAAEARARELARDVDARSAAGRAQAERLEADLEVRDGDRAKLEEARQELVAQESTIAGATAKRESIDIRIRELEATMAAARAVADQVESLEREKAAAAESWRRAKARADSATRAIVELEQLIAGADEVDDAITALPAVQLELHRLLEAQKADVAAQAEIETQRRTLEASDREYSEAVSTYRASYQAARRRVDELAVQVNALEPVTCEKCGHANVVDQAGIRQQLVAARAEFTGLEGAEPQPPAGLLRQRAAITRLESRRREAAFDPAALATAHTELNRLTAIAARGETIAAAKASIAREQAAIEAAAADQAAIAANGTKLNDQLEALRPQLAGQAEAETALASARNEAAIAAGELSQLDSARRQLERASAAAEAHLEVLDRQAAEAVRIREALAADDVELARLRRLVQAFGVTGIPARVIEGVLPELAGYANELLEELRPGMTLELRAQRAKRDGKGVVEALDLVVRDPAGERPLAMFSGGERMSVSLALAIGLSRLVARRAGARIESLVVDEPDGLDSAARRAFGQALRVIAHRGELQRVVLVSHHDDLAEFADEIYQVTKGPEGSVVELVS